MSLSIPLDKLPDVNKEIVLKYIQKISLFDTVVNYVINSKSRRTVNLKLWLNNILDITFSSELIKRCEEWQRLKTSNLKILAIKKFVEKNIRYVGDKETWNADEYWQTPKETWDRKSGDCEDGAILIYCLAKASGIEDWQLYIVAGDVVGGGHCYILYYSDENAQLYPIDWCYWSYQSNLIAVYESRKEYFRGDQEWFRFNSSGIYKLWKKP